MKTTMTFNEVFLKYDWTKFCDIMNLNPYILNEGIAEGNDTITLTEEDLTKLEKGA